MNVGWKEGALTYVEKFKGESIHRIIYQLHGNELTLRATGKEYLGKTSGPTSFSGPLNENLEDRNLTDHLIVDFIRIETDLSTDQKYMLEICRAVIANIVDDCLASKQPGKMGHACWLTLANTL